MLYKTFLGLVVCLFLPTVSATQGAQEERRNPSSLVRVNLTETGLTVEDLQRLDFDLASHHVREAGVTHELICDGDDIELLRTLGIEATIVHEDLAAFYAERARTAAESREAPALGAWLTPPFGSGSMGGFYTLAEVISVLDQITNAYPTITTPRFSIGGTIQERQIWAVKVSDNPAVDELEPEVRFDAVHHAREPQSMQSTIWMMLSLLENYGTDPLATYLVDEREIWFLPIVNPDGYAYNQTINPNGGGMWRKNRRNNGNGSFGVDLNRNYAYKWGLNNSGSSPTPGSSSYRGAAPASEPEIMAMQGFIDSRNFVTAISAHSYSNYWLHPWAYTSNPIPDVANITEVSSLATEVNGYTVGSWNVVLYPGNGVNTDYDFGVHGTYSWTAEIGSQSDGFWPAPGRIIPLAAENELAFRRTALAAGPYISSTVPTLTDLGDGDGNLEPGESFELAVAARNSGLASASVSLSLSTLSAGVTITRAVTSLPAIASFTTATTGASPLAFTIDGGATLGSRVTLSLAITYDGYTEVTDFNYAIGDARTFIRDEAESNVGWLVGDPMDTATAGLWAFGNPVGALYNGEPSNPENDNTPNPGVNCFTTGNGSTTGGGDDVDDGHTTLTTPAIDLSSVSEARISYSRWFALQSVADDEFDVSISDDDGATWQPLETLSQNANAWSDFEFFVSDYVALTSQVRLRFLAEDDPNNSIVEAAVDDLVVTIFDAMPHFNMYGIPKIGTPFAMHVTGEAGEGYVVFGSPGTASITRPNLVGEILISPAGLFRVAEGTIPASGTEQILAPLPEDPGLIGLTFYCQALTIGTQLKTSNRAVVTFE